MTVTPSPRFIESRSPTSGAVLVQVEPDDSHVVNAKAAAARKSGKAWAEIPVQERILPISSMIQSLASDSWSMAVALSLETGRPVQESLGAEVLPSLRGLEYLVKNAATILGHDQIRGKTFESIAQPYGVIGCLGTWNYPLYLNVISIVQALVAGNGVVWKPSELSLYSARRIASLIESSGFPPGLFQIVYGEKTTGEALTHSDCDKFVFTGSTETGRMILAELARSGKPSVMELSGNDAFIVCRDAPIDLAARAAVWGRVCNAGQSCVSPQRFYVDHTIHDQFVNRVLHHLDRLSRRELTPLRTREAVERCHRFVRESIEHGARLRFGGRLPGDGEGQFYRPTLLSDCQDHHSVMAEDLFAPVIAVSEFHQENDAIDRANANPMGLGASVWTSDRRRASTIARQIRAGLVSINSVLLDAADPEVAFGGFGASGFGKLRGRQGLEEFVVRKYVGYHSAHEEPRHMFPYLPAAAQILCATASLRLPGRFAALRDLVRAAIDWRRQRIEAAKDQRQE